MTHNLLNFNDTKTNIIYLTSPNCVKSLKAPPLQRGVSSIRHNGFVENLGLTFYKCINIYEHVVAVCIAAYYHLKNIHCLKRLYHIFYYNINRLHRIQNSAARIVKYTRNYYHIIQSFQNLHWLPVRLRIHFKMLLKPVINLSMT